MAPQAQDDDQVSNAMRTCQEYAVIAYWELESVTDTFECARFFFVPNPCTRTIRKGENSNLRQVLYSSPHSNDVFFFYKENL